MCGEINQWDTAAVTRRPCDWCELGSCLPQLVWMMVVMAGGHEGVSKCAYPWILIDVCIFNEDECGELIHSHFPRIKQVYTVYIDRGDFWCKNFLYYSTIYFRLYVSLKISWFPFHVKDPDGVHLQRSEYRFQLQRGSTLVLGFYNQEVPQHLSDLSDIYSHIPVWVENCLTLNRRNGFNAVKINADEIWFRWWRGGRPRRSHTQRSFSSRSLPHPRPFHCALITASNCDMWNNTAHSDTSAHAFMWMNFSDMCTFSHHLL